MRIGAMAFIIVVYTALAFLYRVAARRQAPRTYVALAGAVVFFVLTAAATLLGGTDVTSASKGIWPAAVIAGISLAAAMPLFMCAVARGNLAISWTILTLSFASAALLTLVYPGAGEVSAGGVAGLAAAAAATVLLGRDSSAAGVKGGFQPGWAFYIALAFLANTGYMYGMALAEAWGGLKPKENQMAFLLAETALFSVIAAAMAATGRPAEGRARALKIGSVIGVLFFAGNYAATATVGRLDVPMYIFFPVTTGGSTLAVALLSALFAGERPGRLGWVGLALGLAAMVRLGSAT
jgi:multidrug transporter EmrE-like cation transporter